MVTSKELLDNSVDLQSTDCTAIGNQNDVKSYFNAC